MPGFLLPAALAAGGALLGGLSKKKSSNKQSQYEYDQARRNYEQQRQLTLAREKRRLDGIDFLQGVAQSKGYNIPDAAFEALKRSGAFEGMSADDAIARPPKEGFGGVLLGALGTGLSTYGGSMLENSMKKADYFNRATAGMGTLPKTGGADDLADYWANLARMMPGSQ